MFKWFKKKPEVVEVPEEALPPPVAVVRQPTNRPQVMDYPRTEYKAYWETFHTVVNNRHNAKVRFCAFNGKVLSESEVSSATKETLFEKVDALVRAKMAGFKV